MKPRRDSPRSHSLRVESYTPGAFEDSALPSPCQAPAPSLTSSPGASVSSSVNGSKLLGLWVVCEDRGNFAWEMLGMG